MSQITNYRMPLNDYQTNIDLLFDNKYTAIPSNHNNEFELRYYEKKNPMTLLNINEEVEKQYSKLLNSVKVSIYCEAPEHYETFDELCNKTSVCISVANK